MLHSTPVVFGPDGQYHPYFCESWQVSADGTEITFKLRNDLVLHDGSKVTSELVKFNIERLMEKSPHATIVYGPYKDTQIIDELTYKVIFSEPYAPVFNGMSISYAAIQSKEAILKAGEQYGHAALVGLGPYKLDSWVSGDKIVLTKNEDYKWGAAFYENRGPAHFDTIEWYTMPDETTRLLALINNEIDLAELPTHEVDNMKANPDINVLSYTPSTVAYLGINSSKEPWSDSRLRQAVAHVIDRDLLVRVALDGHAVANPTPLSPSSWGFDETLFKEAWPLDVNRAKQMLEDAGWKLDADGKRYKDGKVLEMEIWTYTTAPWPRVTEVVREMLISANIQVKITTLESATLLARTPEGVHDAILISYGWPDPDVFHTFLHSSRLDRSNRVHYVNPEFDALLDLQRTIVDPDKRFQVIREIQQMLMKDCPWIPVYTPVVNLGVRKEVKGFDIDARGNYLLLDAYKEITK
jgi:peptide/nickel transport system substrate-binding protein